MIPADLIQAQAWTSTVGSILEFLLILRVVRLGLARVYPAFLAFLICDLSRDMMLRYLEQDFTSESYAIAWSVTAPILWIALLLAVLEIYRLIYRAVPSSLEVRCTIMTAALLASIVITLPMSVELLDHGSRLAAWEQVIRGTNRFVFMAGSLILLTQQVYFARAGACLQHNVRIHRVAFTLCLSADASIRFVSALKDPLIAARANLVCTVLFCASLLVWLFGLRKAQEQVAIGSAIRATEIGTRP